MSKMAGVTLDTVLDQFRADARSNRDLGDRFERLMVRYLELDPIYADRYMTATPRIYGDDAKTKAKQATAEIASMDDPALFGEELHRLGFGEAVGKSLLSDYKVLVLAVDEKYVSKTFQKQIADENSELNLDDAVKITGCWNGLTKRFQTAVAASTDLQGDVAPMRRAVAFSHSIKDSSSTG
jgi:predicted helicase